MMNNPKEQNNEQNQNKISLILFFHEESKACQNLKQFIPKNMNIQTIDIAKTNNIPTVITSLPALIIDNKELLMGKKVFDYFKSNIEFEFYNLKENNSYSNFDNDNSNDNSIYTTIDWSGTYSGVPEWKGENTDEINIDNYIKNRDAEI